MLLINSLLLTFATLGAVIAIRGNTWVEEPTIQTPGVKPKWYHKLTSQGWIAVICLTMSFVLGIIKEKIDADGRAEAARDAALVNANNEQLLRGNKTLVEANERLNAQLGRVEKKTVAFVPLTDPFGASEPRLPGKLMKFAFRQSYPYGGVSSEPVLLRGGERVVVSFFSIHGKEPVKHAELRFGTYSIPLVDFDRAQNVDIYRDQLEVLVPPLKSNGVLYPFTIHTDQPREHWEVVVAIHASDW